MRTLKNVEKSIKWNNWKTKDREEEIRKEIDKLAPPPSVISQIKKQGREEYKEKDVEEEFSKEEFTRAIEMIRRNSAPGRDGIEYRMIKDLKEEMKEILRSIFNEIWIGGQISEDWRKYQVIFIDKIGKEKVRPIALSSCVGKVMERLINERMIWWAEKEEKLAKDQNGFRRGRSCAENITKITTDIRIGNYKSQYTLAAFLDVSSAYNNVVYDILTEKLRDMKCPRNILRYIEKWLNYRDTEFIINAREIVHRTDTKGLPQGAVLSPLLYALYTSSIMNNIEEEIRTVQFADDIAIYDKRKQKTKQRQIRTCSQHRQE